MFKDFFFVWFRVRTQNKTLDEVCDLFSVLGFGLFCCLCLSGEDSKSISYSVINFPSCIYVLICSSCSCMTCLYLCNLLKISCVSFVKLQYIDNHKMGFLLISLRHFSGFCFCWFRLIVFV